MQYKMFLFYLDCKGVPLKTIQLCTYLKEILLFYKDDVSDKTRLFLSVKLVTKDKGLVYLSDICDFLLQNKDSGSPCKHRKKAKLIPKVNLLTVVCFKISSNKTLNSVGSGVVCVFGRRRRVWRSCCREEQLVSAERSTKLFL